MPAVPAQIAIACWRSFGSVKTFVRIDSVAGNISAAPMPVTARHTISCVGLRAERGGGRSRTEHREPRDQRARDGRSGRRWCPAVSSSPANTIV